MHSVFHLGYSHMRQVIQPQRDLFDQEYVPRSAISLPSYGMGRRSCVRATVELTASRRKAKILWVYAAGFVSKWIFPCLHQKPRSMGPWPQLSLQSRALCTPTLHEHNAISLRLFGELHGPHQHLTGIPPPHSKSASHHPYSRPSNSSRYQPKKAWRWHSTGFIRWMGRWRWRWAAYQIY
jgi:hypothetical protein